MAKFDNWNSRKLAAQCVFARLNIDDYFENEVYRTDIKELVAIGCGGFCIFQGDIEKVKKAISELQMLSDVPLLFCSDFENGIQMRLEDGTSFPHSMALARAGEDYTYTIASAIAKEAKDLGVLWNLAPVCDINSNPANPVINIRSFGDNKDIVNKNITKYIEATQAEKVIACAKHFPGHGDTATDSHLTFPILDKSITELEENELEPFIAAINSNVKSIMVGHILVNELDNKEPASLSHTIVTDILRNKLNYNGVILTDGLDMKSITDKYSAVEIAQKAVNAGIDILLIPQQAIEVIEAIKTLIENDNQLKEKVKASVSRIYELKVFTQLVPRFTVATKSIKIFSDHLQLALKAAVNATECIIDKNIIKNINSPQDTDKTDNKASINVENLIPLPENKNYAAFAIVQKAEDIQAASRFFTMLAGATENDCAYAYLDENINSEELNDMKNGISDADFIIFSLFYKGRGYSDNLGSAQKINELIKELSDGRDFIVVFLGDPYNSPHIDGNVKILTYSDSFASLAAAVMILTGRKL